MHRPGSEAAGRALEIDFGGVACDAPCYYNNSRDMFVNPHRGAFVPSLRIAVGEAWTLHSGINFTGYQRLPKENVLHDFRKRHSDIHSFAALLRSCQNDQHTLLRPSGCHCFQVESTRDDLPLTSIANKVTGLRGRT